jgi:hypothetical protein
MRPAAAAGNGGGFIAVLCRFAAGAFPVFLKQFRNGMQRFVDLLSGSKFGRNVRFQDDNISTFGNLAACLPLTPLLKLFRPHCILILR